MVIRWNRKVFNKRHGGLPLSQHDELVARTLADEISETFRSSGFLSL